MNTLPNEPINFTKETVYFGEQDQFNREEINTGLTKREYFAAMAMQGVIASGGTDFSTSHSQPIAEIAVSCADALINELNKPQT